MYKFEPRFPRWLSPVTRDGSTIGGSGQARELEPMPGMVAALDAVADGGLATCVASQGPLKKMPVSLGVAAAKAAGMDVLGFAPEDDGAELAAAGARLFRDMAELPDLLGLG